MLRATFIQQNPNPDTKDGVVAFSRKKRNMWIEETNNETVNG